MKSYKEMLEETRKGLPEVVQIRDRFEIPKVMGHVQGNRTIISNFLQIASTLGREVDHLLKFVLKELATPGEIKKSGALIMGTKVPASRINDKVRKYAIEFVLCPECGKPDTKIEQSENIHYIKCQACGAKNVVKSKI
ncbi:translation initiation factor IF-2 subunit beta [Candidatus Woesearchaeota archaeon]|nr:translation initiation factor IF-2 subunit beta [Candidatus Woesearchaeota archaeon]MBI2131141.1 translation initiation factor IF-2 subunit beta [Candidatus Woesearchaeota archaeon]MBI2661759.1 translation initiation factor IF-2 subunit beta [Candidatus Woesearchaeota archaeon]